MKQGVKHTIKKNASYYLTLTVVNWVDVFTRKNHKKAVVDSLRYCIKNKGLNVYAWCLMSNHLHLVVNCDEPFQLSDVIRDFKRHIVKQVLFQIMNEPESRREWLLREFKDAGLNNARNKEYKFWKVGNHAIELYSQAFVWEKINYIHNNPVEEMFVRNQADWIYSSASNYWNGDGILKEVHCLTRPLQTIR
nr:transposase [uncultured Brumimicrobium sp.]